MKLLNNTLYHSGDFRGTKDSLKNLVNEERVRKHLLIDIWQFYRAERLYLLRVVKEILSNSNNNDHKHQATFAHMFQKLKESGLMNNVNHIRQFIS